MHTNLHPVLKPGSSASTLFSPRGEDINSCLRFLVNIFIASSSAFSLRIDFISFSIDGDNNLLYESLMARDNCSEQELFALIYCFFINSIGVSSSSGRNFNLRNPSFSALNIARTLCEGLFNAISLQAK